MPDKIQDTNINLFVIKCMPGVAGHFDMSQVTDEAVCHRNVLIILMENIRQPVSL